MCSKSLLAQRMCILCLKLHMARKPSMGFILATATHDAFGLHKLLDSQLHRRFSFLHWLRSKTLFLNGSYGYAP